MTVDVDQAAIPENEAPAEEKSKKPMDVKKEILSWILTLGGAVIIALLIRTLIFEPIRVDGASMSNTLLDSEILFVTKPEYLLGDPQRQDIIICRYPNRTEYFVKRLIGLPGDTVEIDGNKVFVNGEQLDEPYLSDDRTRYNHTMAPLTLGEDEYFVMGDNRDNSNDSRNNSGVNAVGPISRGMIVGHVRYVLFPFNQIRAVE